MAEISNEERKQGLTFANQLAELALDAPDVQAESIVHAAVHRLRRRYGYSHKLKKAEIMRRIEKEPLGISITQLKTETGFHRNDVRELVDQLEIELRVVCTKVPSAGSQGGRPTVYARPVAATA